jgi:hypothetical protein
VPKFQPGQRAATVPSAGTASRETAVFFGVSIAIQIPKVAPRFRRGRQSFE